MQDQQLPVAVAGPPAVERALRRLAQAGALAVPVRPVPVDAGGRILLPEGDGATEGLGEGPSGGALSAAVQQLAPDRPAEADQAGAAAGVQVLWRRGVASPGWLDAAIEALPDLRWVHSDFVGVDSVPLATLQARGITFTNGAGNFSRPMAEWVVLAMLYAVKHLPLLVRHSDAGVWDASPQLDELDGKVAVFLGLGEVGTLAAGLVAPFGVEVRALARRGRDAPPPGVARVLSVADWRDDLRDADFVVLAMPLTRETRHIIDSEALAALRPNAWIVNVSRGALIDEAALVQALDEDRIGGAVLDAFVEEPLPPGHPLWGRPNVLVVPHHTWSSPRVKERVEALFASQLNRWTAGEPLANTVDAARGY